MIMGYAFCLTCAFVLAKLVRDNEQSRIEGKPADTPMFKYLVWFGFFAAMVLTGWGLLRMQISETYKAFLGVSWLYLISSAFTLAKMLRDKHEADLNDVRMASRKDAA
jgi:hypothetical protein